MQAVSTQPRVGPWSRQRLEPAALELPESPSLHNAGLLASFRKLTDLPKHLQSLGDCAMIVEL